MSMRTKKSRAAAASRMRRRLSTQVARSIVSPSCVSFSDTLRSIPDAAIASRMATQARVAASAAAIDATLSPR
jgi:hypothetical protein